MVPFLYQCIVIALKTAYAIEFLFSDCLGGGSEG